MISMTTITASPIIVKLWEVIEDWGLFISSEVGAEVIVVFATI